MSSPPLKGTQHAALPPSYWSQRWAHGETQWHLKEVNPDLLATIQELDPIKQSIAPSRRPRMLVPLCGATVDMAYFISEGWHVVGIDAVERVVRTFASEHAGQLRNVKDVQCSAGVHIAADGLDLFVLDFFGPELTAELIGGQCDAVWDRGSLVAIGVQQREAYMERLLSLLRKSTEVNYLLNTCEYNEDSALAAPPHDVPKDVVERLVAAHTEPAGIHVLLVRDGKSRHEGIAGLTRFDIYTFAIRISK